MTRHIKHIQIKFGFENVSMSILVFLKPPYSTGDKTGTKKVFKVLTLLSANLGELKKR